MLSTIGNPGWTGPFDPVADPVWQAMQCGEILERDHWEQPAREFLSSEDPVRALMDALLDQDEVIRTEMAGFLCTETERGSEPP